MFNKIRVKLKIAQFYREDEKSMREACLIYKTSGGSETMVGNCLPCLLTAFGQSRYKCDPNPQFSVQFHPCISNLLVNTPSCWINTLNVERFV